MDTAALIVSIAKLAGASLTLSTAFYEYASGVTNTPKKLNNLAQDVKNNLFSPRAPDWSLFESTV